MPRTKSDTLPAPPLGVTATLTAKADPLGDALRRLAHATPDALVAGWLTRLAGSGERAEGGTSPPPAAVQ
jgi:hypothetical protein